MSVLEIGTAVVELPSEASVPDLDAPHLTTRQTEILRWFANGLGYDETAAELGINRRTLYRHAKPLYRLLGAQNRSHAVGIGFALRLLTPADVRTVEPR